MAGGRPVGSLNKRTNALIALLEQTFPGYNAVLDMARIAHETQDEQVRLAADKEVAKYTCHALKAIEHTGADGEQLIVQIVKFSDNANPAPTQPA